jgi:arylsulfatase A-like enzyme
MKLFTLLTALAVLAVGTTSPGAEKPNIVVILADDLGYADLGCQGCQDVPTPHIDSLAAGGVRCTDGYATHPVCSPSRAGLMSGMYQHRFGFEYNSGPERFAAPNFGLPRNIPTLAERLKEVGYVTGMVGKWHIGFRDGVRPHERGFDFYYGFLSGARNYFSDARDNNPLYRNGERVEDETQYLTDAFARESVAFITRHKSQPFFLYLAFTAVHTPMEATKDYLDRFPGIRDSNRRALAGMLSAMDDAVGRVLDTLRDIGVEENTLIFFYSDNGGVPTKNASRNDPLRGMKGSVFEGGIRIPFMVQWKTTLPAGTTYDKPVMGFDVCATALAAAGATETQDRPLDGVNLIPFLTGSKKGRPHDQLFWRSGRQHAARVGDWKLVVPPGYAPMLFFLKDDIGEQHDLAAEQPDKLKELQTAYTAWGAEMMEPKWIRQDRFNAEPGGKLKPEAQRRRRGARVGTLIEQAFRAADTNGDGKLSKQEYPRPNDFSEVDRNGDGYATAEEVRSYYAGRRLGRMRRDAPAQPGEPSRKAPRSGKSKDKGGAQAQMTEK